MQKTDVQEISLNQQMIDQLEAAGYKILKPFQSKEDFTAKGALPISDPKILMVIDFEATGKDPAKDVPVEIGFVRVEYDPKTGALGRVIERYSGFEDPGIELSEEVQKITHLDRSMLLGHRFDENHIDAAIDASDFFIAHNASYDRVMGERRFPNLADKPWGCTFREGPWEAMGLNTRSQEFLAFKVAGIHYGAHRALADCEALLEIMASPAHDGRPCFSHVLETSHKPTYTVWAQGASFDRKDILRKDGGYRLNAEDPGKIAKTWFKEGVSDLSKEFDFLKANVYGYNAAVGVDTVTAMARHSQRVEDRQSMKLLDAVSAPALEDLEDLEDRQDRQDHQTKYGPLNKSIDKAEPKKTEEPSVGREKQVGDSMPSATPNPFKFRSR